MFIPPTPRIMQYLADNFNPTVSPLTPHPRPPRPSSVVTDPFSEDTGRVRNTWLRSGGGGVATLSASVRYRRRCLEVAARSVASYRDVTPSRRSRLSPSLIREQCRTHFNCCSKQQAHRPYLKFQLGGE
ncbi:hypothetical protein J6590_071265 [Homalodisca vitripennis]|nr:hypothetical protein J6590_071265 [Homalodisca vitripennis]